MTANPLFNPGHAPAKCRHPRRVIKQIVSEPEPVWAEVCANESCDHVFDPEKKRKGKNVNDLAKAIERWVCRTLGITRVGQYGGQSDGGKSDEWCTVQIKSGPQWFLPKMYTEVAALNAAAGQRRALVVVEKPGPGGHRRALWVEILEEVPHFTGLVE